MPKLHELASSGKQASRTHTSQVKGDTSGGHPEVNRRSNCGTDDAKWPEECGQRENADHGAASLRQ